jgi:hypothetical protein
MIRSAKQFLKTFAPAKVVQSRLHKRVFMQFAEKFGFVYFGFVDQRSDDHRLVRGLTLSAQHRDNHYCIGTFQNYDVTLVERTDTITFPGKPARTHTWTIMVFDLHTAKDLPHIFLGLHSHNETFYAHLFTKFSHLAKSPLGTFGSYDPAFMKKYAIYTQPAKALEAEQLFDHQTAKIIGEQFGGLTIETDENCLYIYGEHHRPTEAHLEKMLKYGAWLAGVLDEKLKSAS